METRERLAKYLEECGIRPKGNPSNELYPDNWFRVPLMGRRVPIFPLGGIKQSLVLHDIHHMVTGYDTDWKGELEIAGWELGSGGCARHKFMWFDRGFTFLLALIAAPAATLRAFRRGTRSRNLYGSDLDSILEMEFDEVQRLVKPSA